MQPLHDNPLVQYAPKYSLKSQLFRLMGVVGALIFISFCDPIQITPP